MGAPMIEDERLYSFFDEFKANMDADVETSEGLYLQEKQQLNDELSTFSSAYTVLNKTLSFRNINWITEKFYVTLRTVYKGVVALSLGKPPDVSSRLPYMHKEKELMNSSFRTSTNEWLDAFLFEVAASWKDIVNLGITEKLSKASNNLVTKSPDSQVEKLQSYTAFNEKSVSELLDYSLLRKTCMSCSNIKNAVHNEHKIRVSDKRRSTIIR